MHNLKFVVITTVLLFFGIAVAVYAVEAPPSPLNPYDDQWTPEADGYPPSGDATPAPTGGSGGPSTDIIVQIVSKFKEKTDAWSSVLTGVAMSLFRTCVILNILVFGVRAALNRSALDNILKEFALVILFTMFMWAVIANYHEWSWNIINGLKKISGQLGGASMVESGPIDVGLAIVKNILNGITKWEPMNAFGMVLCAALLLIVFALITAQIVFVKCEAMIALNAATLLLGFGGLTYTKEYAFNAMRYALAVGIKLFVLEVIITIAMQFAEELKGAPATFESIFVVLGASIVLLALSKSIPEVCAGIVSGSHVSSGHALGSAVAGIAGAAAGMAIGAAATGVRGASATAQAASMASAAGKTGFGAMGHMAGSMFKAHKDAFMQGDKRTHTGRAMQNLRRMHDNMKKKS
ncbi:P-type conjugative transfer protein TrbL [Fundidesulfovibrio putealis]|uniref:P-type conjugative transfer protein TrbL n=1 Tax=Fundidesulfovibrio putealis TaxID=270496 RepID=UPI0013A859DF|nr:P-type conjugative transfer protein TrbL [Fundidesulfovibrio putealis]KAF0234911.1 MAG: P-type conjugative transfer protein [Desulfovibrionaceae bacterium]